MGAKVAEALALVVQLEARLFASGFIARRLAKSLAVVEKLFVTSCSVQVPRCRCRGAMEASMVFPSARSSSSERSSSRKKPP